MLPRPYQSDEAMRLVSENKKLTDEMNLYIQINQKTEFRHCIALDTVLDSI